MYNHLLGAGSRTQVASKLFGVLVRSLLSITYMVLWDSGVHELAGVPLATSYNVLPQGPRKNRMEGAVLRRGATQDLYTKMVSVTLLKHQM